MGRIMFPELFYDPGAKLPVYLGIIIIVTAHAVTVLGAVDPAV